MVIHSLLPMSLEIMHDPKEPVLLIAFQIKPATLLIPIGLFLILYAPLSLSILDHFLFLLFTLFLKIASPFVKLGVVAGLFQASAQMPKDSYTYIAM